MLHKEYERNNRFLLARKFLLSQSYVRVVCLWVAQIRIAFQSIKKQKWR